MRRFLEMDLDWVVDQVEDVHNSLKFPAIKLNKLAGR